MPSSLILLMDTQKVLLRQLKKLKSELENVDIVAGNVATGEACKDLIKAELMPLKLE